MLISVNREKKKQLRVDIKVDLFLVLFLSQRASLLLYKALTSEYEFLVLIEFKTL